MWHCSLSSMVTACTQTQTTASCQQEKNVETLFALMKNQSQAFDTLLCTIQESISQGASPDAKDTEECPALIYAAQAKTELMSIFLTKALLHAHAHIDAQDAQGNTALLHAVKQCRPNLASFLLYHGANKDITNKNNECYDHIAPIRFVRDVNDTLSYNKNLKQS